MTTADQAADTHVVASVTPDQAAALWLAAMLGPDAERASSTDRPAEALTTPPAAASA